MKLQAVDGHKSNRRAPRACGCCLLTPIVFALCLFVAYKIDNSEPQITLPGHSMPQDNARDYFHRASVAAKLMKHKSPYDMSGPPAQSYTLANFQGCAYDAEPALKILREGLNHPYMNPAERSMKINTFPVYAECRKLERVNAGAADYYEVTGDPGRALQMRLDGLEMGVMMPRGGVLIAGLVGIACEAIAESRMEPLISNLSSSQLAAVATRLDRIAAKRVPYSDIILEEGYMQTAGIMELLKDSKISSPGAMADILSSDDDDEKAAWSKRMSHDLAEVKFVMASKQAILRTNLEWYAAMAQEARGPYSGPSKVRVPNNLIAQMSGDTLKNARVNFESVRAVSALLRLEVALHRYKNDHGTFPPVLADLAPAYLELVPSDPFGGSAGIPMRYVLHSDGGSRFELYSIGPDMKDDGGVPSKFPGTIPGDIVAGKLYNKGPILYSGAVRGQ